MKLLYPGRFLLIFCLCAILASCTKSDKCPDPIQITITQNGPVVAGWPLELEASIASTGYLYKWDGPNGWKMHYEIYASDANLQHFPAVTTAEAGEYRVQLIDYEGCVAYEGSTIVEVTEAPTASCNIANNTSTSSVAGVGDYTFNYRSFSGGGNFYFASGSEVTPGGHFMRFAFLGGEQPLPGIYYSGGYFGLEYNKVGLYIETGTYQFVANPNQKVYVTKVNGKLEIKFCSLIFNNPMNPSNPLTISASLTQP
jgi:hypothetical protein